MSSRLLSSLEQLANKANSEVERSVFRAQWAGAMARLGHLGAARKEVQALRIFNANYEPRLTAWIMLAEGQIDHYESLSVAALDKFKRAYGIGIAAKDDDTASFAAAWMSASEFQVTAYHAATKHSLEAISLAPATGYLARSRAHLVLANILCAIGWHQAAPAHYAKARTCAIEAHDISMQSAVLYNVAAFRISRISLDDAFDVVNDEELRLAELELNSIVNLDRGIGVDSLGAMIPILQGQLLMMKRQWGEADLYFARAIPEASTYGPLRWEPRFLAEQAYCQAMLGRVEIAASQIARAAEQLNGTMHLDDLAACHARIALVSATLGNSANAEMHMKYARQCAAKLADLQADQRRELAPLLAEIHPLPS